MILHIKVLNRIDYDFEYRTIVPRGQRWVPLTRTYEFNSHSNDSNVNNDSFSLLLISFIFASQFPFISFGSRLTCKRVQLSFAWRFDSCQLNVKRMDAFILTFRYTCTKTYAQQHMHQCRALIVVPQAIHCCVVSETKTKNNETIDWRCERTTYRFDAHSCDSFSLVFSFLSIVYYIYIAFVSNIYID